MIVASSDGLTGSEKDVSRIKRIKQLEAENAALLQKIDKLELRINGDARNLAYADAEIGRLRARVAELELQVSLLMPSYTEVTITGSDHTNYDGEGVA